MSYTPTEWQTGDTITAEKLNNMENGIEAAAVVHIPVKTRNTPGYPSFYIDAADVDEVYAALAKANSFVFDIYQIGFDALLIEIPCKKLVLDQLSTWKCVYGNIPHDIQFMFEGISLPSLKADSLYIMDNEYQSGSDWPVNNGTLFDTSPLIVTLTPTAQDFSGVMDKTVGEIKAAYKSWRDIKFRVSMGATEYLEVQAAGMDMDTNDDTLVFTAYIIDTSNSLIIVAYNTMLADDADTYSTTLYPLTPMSP